MEELKIIWEEFQAIRLQDSTLEEFEILRTDGERFHFCRDLLRHDPESQKILTTIKSKLEKSSSDSFILKSHHEAIQLKLKGDRFLVSGLYKKAVEAYSESICEAPTCYPTEHSIIGCSCAEQWIDRPRHQPKSSNHFLSSLTSSYVELSDLNSLETTDCSDEFENCQQCIFNREHSGFYTNLEHHDNCLHRNCDLCDHEFDASHTCSYNTNGTLDQECLEDQLDDRIAYDNKGSEFVRGSSKQALDVRISLDCAQVECNKKNFYLARVIASRAEALFQLGHFENCLSDIQECFSVGCPLNLIMRLNYYKAHCLAMLGRPEDAIEVFDEMLYKGAEKDLPTEIKKSLIKKRRILSKNIMKLEQESVPQYCYNSSMQQLPQLAKGDHSDISNCSKLVQIMFNKSQGRFLKAGHEIKAGDVLILESPYAAVLLPENQHSHCNHCFKNLLAPYPCQSCNVRYCSQECRDTAWSKYHSRECSLLPLLNIVDTFSHLSLRILLVTKPSTILDVVLHDSLDHIPSVIPGCTLDGKYKGDYGSIYSLVTNAELQPTRTLLLYTLNAALLTEFVCDHVRQNTGPRNGHVDGTGNSSNVHEPSECEALISDDLIGGLLIHHLQQMACNVHAVTAIVPAQDEGQQSVVTREQRRIATAIYSTASLLNHACDPDVIISFVDNKLVVRATHNIQQGLEITHCYGPHVSRMTREARQRLLREQYFFTCKCVSCRSDEEQEKKLLCFTAFACPKCCSPLKPNREPTLNKRNSGVQGICQNDKCRHEQDLTEWIEQARQGDILFRKAFTFLENDELEQGIQILKQCLKLRKVLHLNHKDLAETHDALARCYAANNDFRQASVYCTLSTNAVEKMFGSTSVEFAHELHKLSQLLFNDQQVKKAMEVITKATKLLAMHYGENYPEVLELIQMRSCLMEVIKRRTSNGFI